MYEFHRLCNISTVALFLFTGYDGNIGHATDSSDAFSIFKHVHHTVVSSVCFDLTSVSICFTYSSVSS